MPMPSSNVDVCPSVVESTILQRHLVRVEHVRTGDSLTTFGRRSSCIRLIRPTAQIGRNQLKWCMLCLLRPLGPSLEDGSNIFALQQQSLYNPLSLSISLCLSLTIFLVLFLFPFAVEVTSGILTGGRARPEP